MAKKISEPFKLKQIFAEFWSAEYKGQIYGGGTRDLRSAKEYLELNPEFFLDETLIMDFKEKTERFMKDRFWYKPNGNPPMFHPMYCFLNNIEKYADAKKSIDNGFKQVKQPVRRMIFCTDCGSNHFPDEQCKIQSPEEIQRQISESIK